MLLFVLLLISAWPAFVGSATLLATIGGDAWQLNAWTLLPKRVLLQEFINGYRDSLLPAALCACLGVIDHWLLSRAAATRWLRGLLLPVAGAAVALLLLPEHTTALLTLVLTGVLLAAVSRLVLAIVDRILRRWSR